MRLRHVKASDIVIPGQVKVADPTRPLVVFVSGHVPQATLGDDPIWEVIKARTDALRFGGEILNTPRKIRNTSNMAAG